MVTAFFFCLLANGLGGTSESPLPAAFFLWWSAAPAERLADGRARQAVSLMSHPAINIEEAEVWFRVRPLPRFNQAGDTPAETWRQGKWAEAETWTAAFQSGNFVQVDILAKAQIDGRPHFAQTRLLLYGRNEGPEDDGGAPEATPPRPEFTIRSKGEFYWPQTGHEFSIAFQGLDMTNPNRLEVRNGRGELLAELPPEYGVFRYIPARDPELDRAGYTAGKPLIFVTRDGLGNSASYTLVVHRSRVAGLNKKAGLGLMAATAAFAFLAVGLKRRRVRPCP